jgi:excisionase family DNA binding protein
MLLTVAEAAAVTGLGVGYVEKAIAGRMVEARALGRRGARVIRREDLPALVDALWGSRDRS